MRVDLPVIGEQYQVRVCGRVALGGGSATEELIRLFRGDVDRNSDLRDGRDLLD